MKTKKELQTRAGELLIEIDAIRDKEQVSDEERGAVTEKLAELKKINADIDSITTLDEQRKLVESIPDETQKDERSVITDVEDRAAKKPWRDFGEFIQAIILAGDASGDITINGKRSGYVDKRLFAQNQEERTASGMNESVPSTGGFLVQTDFSTDLMDKVHASSLLLPRTDKGTISSNANGITVPGVDETSRADGSRAGGVLAYWKDEAAQKTKSKPKFREINLKLNKLTGLVYLTDELMQDAAFLASWVATKFQEEFRFKVDDAIYRGTGAGQPLGILTSGAPVTVAKETGQPAATIVFENIIKMYSRMFGVTRSRANLVWVANQDTIPQLMAMNMAVGTGGVPVWLPANGIAGQPFDTLMGIPILFIEQASTLGTVGDIGLFNMKEYMFVDKGGFQSATSIHLRFDYDETVLRFVWRLDGQPKWNQPLTPYKGTATQSPFVLLATRS